MTDASGPAYILPSRFRKDDRMLYSNIATNIVESLPGIWGNKEKGGGGYNG